MAQTNPLRVYVRVPQPLIHAITPGQKAELTFQEMPGRNLRPRHAHRRRGGPELAHVAGGIAGAQSARRNFRRQLRAGALQRKCQPPNVLTLSDNALIFRAQGMQVAVVGSRQQSAIAFRQARTRFWQHVEVLAGSERHDRVINNPPDSIADGRAGIGGNCLMMRN
jgi:hypothetical protein